MSSILDVDLSGVKSYWIYVLRLDGLRYYVGKTDNIETRLAYHFNGGGALYTQFFKPVKCIYKEEVTDPRAELECFIAVAKKHGLRFVRGAAFCQVDDDAHVKQVMATTKVSKEFL